MRKTKLQKESIILENNNKDKQRNIFKFLIISYEKYVQLCLEANIQQNNSMVRTIKTMPSSKLQKASSCAKSSRKESKTGKINSCNVCAIL